MRLLKWILSKFKKPTVITIGFATREDKERFEAAVKEQFGNIKIAARVNEQTDKP